MSDKKTVVGNWKMHGLLDQSKELINNINHNAANCDVIICPPFTAIHLAVANNIPTCGQDCYHYEAGAYTGDISPLMLKDAGCQYVLLGHSERRKMHNESSDLIGKKALAAHKVGLMTIICIGETLDDRDAGRTFEILTQQIKLSIPVSADCQNTIIAYEPVWAIGTGKVATIEQILETHDFINQYMVEHFPLFQRPVNALYGGSVKADNAAQIMAVESVGGVLVGGASLDAQAFNKIIDVA